MKPTISVIVCTHNPRHDYLQRVLQALQNQSLSRENWELLLIDNASKTVLAEEINLQWHPLARHIREEKLGLTHARLRGIEESTGKVLIFVDDDNVLDSDFLENNLQIEKDWSVLGAWGGRIVAEFETEPPEWTKPYWDLLAIREFEEDRWSNSSDRNHAVPCGAGLCIRKVVAQKYAELVSQDSRRALLGRKGGLMTSCEDSDLALTACDLGLGTGQFKSLKLTHLISSNRIKEDYLISLVKGIAYSSTILKALRGKLPIQSCNSQKIFEKYKRWRMKYRERYFYDAKQIGEKMAFEEIASW